ncbi:MAG: hypothetical protein H8E44_41950 [Planctomycetes bacterium]|nr:hypothetical protein [Planctomycetota bacterium]MBL7043574.1 hypothetical protein [Pirellulaceae bacterium]
MAEFGEFDFAFPFVVLKDAKPGECSNVVKALEDAPDAWLSAVDKEIEAADANQDWPFKARLAIVALHLGDPSLAEEMCELGPDPIERIIFIDEITSFHGDLVVRPSSIVRC